MKFKPENIHPLLLGILGSILLILGVVMLLILDMLILGMLVGTIGICMLFLLIPITVMRHY